MSSRCKVWWKGDEKGDSSSAILERRTEEAAGLADKTWPKQVFLL